MRRLRRCIDLTRRLLPIIVIPLCGVAVAKGAIIADFAADLQPVAPTPGWSYLWNRVGAQIGDPANYDLLVAVAQPDRVYYDLDGGALPRATPASFLSFLSEGFPGDGLPGGHPGQGFLQASDGIEHFAIAAFTLSADGDTKIVNSFLRTADSSFDGIHARVFVNNQDTGVNAITGGFHLTTSFDTALGFLHAGDTIYVAVGGGFSDFGDSFNLGYQIDQVAPVPEPGSLTIFAIGGVLCSGSTLLRRMLARRKGIVLVP